MCNFQLKLDFLFLINRISEDWSQKTQIYTAFLVDLKGKKAIISQWRLHGEMYIKYEQYNKCTRKNLL